MLRTTSRPALAAALALATTVTLTGCGLLGGDDEAGGTGSPSAPATSGSTATSTPESGSPGETESEQDRPRPSKAQVVAGLKKFYGGADKSKSYDHDKLANCIADRGYDRLSSKTLHALKDAKPSEMDKSESATFAAYAVSCAPGALPSGSRPPLPTIPNGPKLPTGLPTGIPTTMPSGLPTKLPSNFPTAPPT